MYVDENMVEEALYQYQNGEIDFSELNDMLSWYDGDIAELFKECLMFTTPVSKKLRELRKRDPFIYK